MRLHETNAADPRHCRFSDSSSVRHLYYNTGPALPANVTKVVALYKLSFYVPETHLEVVKNAVFNAGAGQYDRYDQCCWQCPGTGQFRPLAGSQPYLGELNKLETLPEYKVEMVCADECISAAVTALKLAHPYEEPAYDVWQLALPE